MTLRFQRPFLAALLLLLFFVCPGLSDDTKSDFNSELVTADKDFQSGKFARAETEYRAILKRDSTQLPAQVGLIRSLLRLDKIDDASDSIHRYLAQKPGSARLLALKGDVQFRRAEMNDAQDSYWAALKSDPKEVHAHLGLARLYGAFSLYRKAYDRLETAHSIAPDDVEVQRAWFRAWAPTLPRKERLAALERYLSEGNPDDEKETRGLQDELEFLKATADQPAHACKLISNVERTDTNLVFMKAERTDTKLLFTYREDRKVQGVGLPVTLNDYQARMELDTGASGLTISRKVAQIAGLVPISAEHIAGIGGKGEQSGYIAVAEHIQIGELRFQDCLVSVSAKESVGDGDGLIGADVFGSYLVDIDFPEMQLKLSPLPKRPEDAVAPKRLNSEGEEQAGTEQQDQAATADSIDHQGSFFSVQENASRLPKDRYIAPEMADWTKVFRFHHQLLVPTLVNDSPAAVLFILDSGAFGNILSLRVARQVGKVHAEVRTQVVGLGGEVKKVYSARATLRFGRLHQPDQEVIAFDLSSVSRDTGTEVSGFLGYAMLRILEVKIDYRDGLVNFEYDPKRIAHILRALQR